MPEVKVYKAKLVDQISERGMSKNIFEECYNKTGTLMFQNDGCLLFIIEDGGNLRTSELQAEPCWRGNELIFVTRNSTYVFEIYREIEKIA
jgi:hypothetical protein